MAFYQLLLFRKGHYRRQVPTKYAEKRKLQKNIKRKRKQIDDAKWNFCANLWAMPFTGGLSGVSALICLRNNHIAHQKLKVLEKRYSDEYKEKVPQKREKRKGILKKICGCVADPAVGDTLDSDSDSDSDSDDDENDEKDKKKRGSGKASKRREQETELVQSVSDVVDNAPTDTLSYDGGDSSIQEVRS